MEKRRKNRIILSRRYSDTRFRRKKTGSSQQYTPPESGRDEGQDCFFVLHSGRTGKNECEIIFKDEYVSASDDLTQF